MVWSLRTIVAAVRLREERKVLRSRKVVVHDPRVSSVWNIVEWVAGEHWQNSGTRIDWGISDYTERG